MSKPAWERGYRDGLEGRYDPPSKSLFDPFATDRYAYKDGYESGKKTVPEKKLDLRGAFLRRTDLSSASLKHANLKEADFTEANFRDADFEGATLEGTILKGADLRGAKNLTLSQLRRAVLDENTKLPEGFSITQILQTQQQAG